MCGIVGAVAQRDVADILVDGLHRLEYRGYDSAGVAVLNATTKEMQVVRRVGKVKELENAVAESNVIGGTGIAHTRWATHGEPSETNAHPHVSGKIAVVHNGIIENYEELREELKAKGYEFLSQTDTEVIAHLVEWELRTSETLLDAVKKTVKQLRGAYGTVVMNQDEPEHLIVARSGSPLVIGLGVGENFIASDPLALLSVTHRFIYLEEGDVAEITRKTVDIFDSEDKPVQREIHESQFEHDAADKGQYRHYMQKEIFEQPVAIINTLEGRITNGKVNIDAMGKDVDKILEKVEHIQIVACGTSYNAGMVARYWFESIAGVSCDVEIASEFRYRKFVTRPNSLLVTLSQSGETADTLAALRLAQESGFMSSMAICNVASSSLVRESDFAFMTKAGVEIGVASTKAFTTQLTCLLLLTAAIGRLKGNLSEQEEKQIVQSLQRLPAQIESALVFDKEIEKLSQDFAEKHHTLFLGRGEFYPIAMESALKLKEISYIHAEAYAAGELKHGPLALIDSDMPVVVIAPENDLLEKVKSNIEEVSARGGQLYIFADKDAGFTDSDNFKTLVMPKVDQVTAPIFYTVPLQLLSYHIALIKGTDVDQPRNLAKAVTVE
ncbi:MULTISPECIES: glutamine--fructose-6-phosphate transaminase (isomerizing) [Pasteurellaceae]|uniref:Glutamine--fructose-6-phosphate aminotransferase [isomerizing] n=1 Tax=Pasteurella atlantica TaxID=2827233 RepID=A0AAW8CDX6_9PAST|nr:glutamine--fructose-6-phosphate transaminase (isomerizing) [Pasteurella atlantica]MBR0573159.1 glutamine--fructose-6-phosphate transaminase (isomerizing) [Pasteurella atlantica]MDP8038984.1 glutamine--fructose-6-phosphate transaminase (isomerizing) [Pasteurella atlantica]MDP8041074.1 glutamine--fructose-6-phosphate transaminase (isomerizing) [Pasteurella atlantica]MDP8043313.1 glutamine--fructose-6-phosphate transaminase (isomerizing) [Pasteurella atlantica]MDP8045399.1 glutamine--fructose-